MELVKCISERKSMPGQITIGKKYWVDYSSRLRSDDYEKGKMR